MEENTYFTESETRLVTGMVKQLRCDLKASCTVQDFSRLRRIITGGVTSGSYRRDRYGINPVVRSLNTATALCANIAPDRSMTIAVLLYNLCRNGYVSEEEIAVSFGSDVATLVEGLIKISNLYKKQAAVGDENFRKLLLTLARDIRVVIIMIVDRLTLMRAINHHPDEKFVRDVAHEARYLYAPLAHKLGLYQVKTELEDLSLKYLQRDVYTKIARQLNATKEIREQYISDFIAPVREVLDRKGIDYYIKGRTKSINSIWNKMRKKQVDMNDMYDLFAIRVIISTAPEREKHDCWMAYSLVGERFTPNPDRLRDWITVPKSNGYESLHGTFLGPQNKWVEVQFRTKRMDEIAEKGLAAHWRYKGVKADGGEIERWINNVREVLEDGNTRRIDLIRDMNNNRLEDEVYVFTPKGDVFSLPAGATILDFAFRIHSRVGCSCTGGKVDGKNQKINYRLHSGDTVEILTSPTQVPRVDWLNFVVTGKARNKIRQALNEARSKKADMGRELLQRRFKNRKIDIVEATMSRFIAKKGYKTSTDFFVAVDEEKFDIATLIDEYLDFQTKLSESGKPHETAENFVLQKRADENEASQDILVIGNDVKGINYKLSRCCNPIFGDAIDGFVASDGAIKIHRRDCPNMLHLRERYPYRIIRSRWSGKMGNRFATTLKVVGHDDIGIVANITSLISKEGDTILRSVSIASNGGLFEGFLGVAVPSLEALDLLIKKIKNLKGVKDVQRAAH